MTTQTPIVADASFLIPILRNPGYKNLSYAVAEIFDNAIDAGAQNILSIVGSGSEGAVNEIGFLDDGYGMDQEKLSSCLRIGGRADHRASKGKGQRGKYGYGLPGATFGFSEAVEVYSWEKPNEIFMVSVSLEQIANGIPKPTKVSKLPERYESLRVPSAVIKMRGNTVLQGVNFQKNGTLIIWKGCERVRPRTPKLIVERYLEPDLGRMFRHFITDDKWSRQFWNKCSIYIGYCDRKGSVENVMAVRPNDPLYMMPDHRLVSEKVEFSPYDTPKHKKGYAEFKLNGTTVRMRVSLAPKDVRMEHQGRGKINDQVGRNYGISVLREGREVELDSFAYFRFDQRNRWWGIEIHFDKGADEYFGVPANKQYATRLREIRESDEVEGASYPPDCTPEDMPIWLALERNFDLTALTHELLKKIRAHAEEGGSDDAEDVSDPDDLPEDPSEKDEGSTSLPPDEKERRKKEAVQNIIAELKAIGFADPTDEQIQRFMRNQVVVSYVAMGSTGGFMDVSLKPGFCNLRINTESVFYQVVLNELKERRSDPGIEEIYHGLMTILVAYARCMDLHRNYECFSQFPKVLLKWSTKVEELLRTQFEE